jgi:hypothetical protein
LQLKEIIVRLVTCQEHARYHKLMQDHHYLGSAHPVGETLHYIAIWRKQWIALLSFSSAALKCAPRDQWIGWRYRHQFDRLNLVTNNSRFLILPQWHTPNAATRILSLCQRRLQADWMRQFHHPLLLLETFVDPQYFHGTIYRAANWTMLGNTKGFRRASAQGYQPNASPKLVFVYALQRNAQHLLSQSYLNPAYQCGIPKLMLTANQMNALPAFFKSIPDPRRTQGRRHRLETILAIATGAILCGRVGYKGIAEWAQSLGQDARTRFQCYYKQGRYHAPSEYIIRDILIRVKPDALDQALRHWSEQYSAADESLAIDGKTMSSAIDNEGKQVHIMSAIGHETLNCYTQKKSGSSAQTAAQ